MRDDLKLYFRLLSYVKPHWPRYVAATLAMLGVSGLTVLLAYLVKQGPQSEGSEQHQGSG